MELKEYFDLELKATVIYAMIAAIVGYVSFLIDNSLMSLVFAIVVLIVTYALFNRKVKKEVRWWLSNGVIVYLFVWVLIWSIFYTMRFYSTLS